MKVFHRFHVTIRLIIDLLLFIIQDVDTVDNPPWTTVFVLSCGRKTELARCGKPVHY